jgi:nucleotide-binding universal stress UspA family protein
MIVKDPPHALNHVLLCTDGSPFAEQAVDFWGRLPKVSEPRVVVLNIIPKLFSGFSSELKSVTPDLLKVLAKVPGSRTAIVNRAKDILERYDIEVKTKLREQEYAAEEILKEEKEVDYDLIIMGYRGAKYRGKSSAGSQSLAVAMQSQTSVLIYQPKAGNGGER